jgi:hypothetical protein
MVSHAPPVVTPPPVLRRDWETIARLDFTQSRSLNLDVYPAPSHHAVGFEVQLTNHRPLDFEAKKTVAVILSHKSPNFEAQIIKP